MSDSVSDWHDRHDDCNRGPFGPYDCEEPPRQASHKNQDRAPMRVSDVSDNEVTRWYAYKDHVLGVNRPWRVFVSESGSHRVQDLDGDVHYIPRGWVALSWRPKDQNDPVKF